MREGDSVIARYNSWVGGIEWYPAKIIKVHKPRNFPGRTCPLKFDLLYDDDYDGKPVYEYFILEKHVRRNPGPPQNTNEATEPLVSRSFFEKGPERDYDFHAFWLKSS